MPAALHQDPAVLIQGTFDWRNPAWDVRSAIILEAGRWEMRNGHHAIVHRSQAFDAKRDGKPIKFTVWFGRCEECNEGRSWNANGTYAANGKHQWDIIGRAE